MTLAVLIARVTIVKIVEKIMDIVTIYNAILYKSAESYLDINARTANLGVNDRTIFMLTYALVILGLMFMHLIRILIGGKMPEIT